MGKAAVATKAKEEKAVPDVKQDIVWFNVISHVILHALAIYSITLIPYVNRRTVAWGVACFTMTALGITAGVHRLWSHRAYKAKLPLRILLAAFNSMSFQMSIFEWARDHRTHHKYSDTAADPHNANRGFFYCHIGWLMVRKRPEVIEKGSKIDISDLYEDPVVMFQKRHYAATVIVMCFAFPTAVPLLWGEDPTYSFLLCLLRLTTVLNFTWLVNSAAHYWGNKPYDLNMRPSDNMIVVLLATGEGFHNFHHSFPQDYSSSEFGVKYNFSTAFIDFMAMLGLASDRRSVSPEMILARKKRTGELMHED